LVWLQGELSHSSAILAVTGQNLPLPGRADRRIAHAYRLIAHADRLTGPRQINLVTLTDGTRWDQIDRLGLGQLTMPPLLDPPIDGNPATALQLVLPGRQPLTGQIQPHTQRVRNRQLVQLSLTRALADPLHPVLAAKRQKSQFHQVGRLDAVTQELRPHRSHLENPKAPRRDRQLGEEFEPRHLDQLPPLGIGGRNYRGKYSLKPT
jgi:hypothetical protein